MYADFFTVFSFCLFIYSMDTYVHEKSFQQSRAMIMKMINHVISQAESHEKSGRNL